MRTSGAWRTCLIGPVVGLPLLFVALCFGLYLLSSRYVPDTLPAPAAHRAPDTVRAQFLAIETGGATRMRRLDPVTFWIEFARLANGREASPEMRLLSSATRHAQFRDATRRSQGERHLASIAWTIDISRQWSFDQAVDTLLAESYFGRDSVGIDAAAQAYFGTAANDLRPQESLALIVLMRGPSFYNLDCQRERFDRRYAWAAQTLGKTGPDWTPAAALARLRPGACVRRDAR